MTDEGGRRGLPFPGKLRLQSEMTIFFPGTGEEVQRIIFIFLTVEVKSQKLPFQRKRKARQ